MLRISGGRFRGRHLSAPKGRQTRPTSEMVRQGIFNTLSARVNWEHTRVLDLFAGSGALGIEALSRGAPHIAFVEAHAPTAAGIRANLDKLGVAAGEAKVVVARVESWLRHPQPESPRTLVLMDPPYAFGQHEEVLILLREADWILPGAVIVVETDKRRVLAVPPGLDTWRTKRYGDTQIWYLVKSSGPSAPETVEAAQ